MLYKNHGSFFIDIIKIFVNPICSFSRMTSLIGIGVGELALAKVRIAGVRK